MQPIVYYDYTCSDSHRLKQLFDRLGRKPKWRTFSLKENKRHDDEPSFFEGNEISSISILALALAHSLRDLDFYKFHSEVFDAFHEEGRRLTRDEILLMADKSGLEPASFHKSERDWLARVAAEHRHAVEVLGVFGTPTVILGESQMLYVELAQVPETARAAKEVWSLIEKVASRSEIGQLERPESA
jgi:protein-disulfide isomerase-like protein with CxxC motif